MRRIVLYNHSQVLLFAQSLSQTVYVLLHFDLSKERDVNRFRRENPEMKQINQIKAAQRVEDPRFIGETVVHRPSIVMYTKRKQLT